MMHRFIGRPGLLVTILLALLVTACAQNEQKLAVGSKDFTEQLILGEIIAQMAEGANIPVQRQIPYGGTFDNMEALKRGDIDVYAEYNGTALLLLGQAPIANGDESYQRVVELYTPLGLIWGRRLGFSNNYELIMRRDRAEELGIENISDLSRIEGAVDFGIDNEFQVRPIDGYSPMLRRYGLNGNAALVTDDTAEGKAKLYQALLDGQVDVIEGFSTDGQIADFGLLVLDDDLGFFPVYQPAPLMRQAALDRFPNLRPALERLAGLLSTDQMQALNAAVELNGQAPATVARRFLAENDLVEADTEKLTAEPLQVAVGYFDALSGQTAEALSAVRKTFIGRQVTPLRVADPMGAMLSGQARVALVSAEAFYQLGEGVFPQQRQNAQAVGVVGYDVLHLLTRRDGEVNRLADIRRLGVGAAGGGTERVARMMLTSLGRIDAVQIVTADAGDGEPLASQVDALRQGQIDALMIMADQGYPEIAGLLRAGDLRLMPLPEWQRGNNLVRFPFLRVSRIPADTYPNMTTAVDTIGAQVVLAAPLAKADPIGTAGPGSAAVGDLLPLSGQSILTLNKALAVDEKIDPSLPSAGILNPQPRPTPAAINPSSWRSLVNFLVICVTIYLSYLYFRKEPRKRTKRASGT